MNTHTAIVSKHAKKATSI